MNVVQLRYLVAVVEVGSITRAASLLGVSAPTVSKALQRLENTVGAPLFVPDGRGVSATALARDLARRADRVLVEWQELERSLREQRQIRTAVRIASFETFTTYFLGELVSEALVDSDVSIVSAVPGAVESAVADATADIGFTYVATPTAGVQHVRIGSARMVVATLAGGEHEHAPVETLPFAVPASGVGSTLPRHRAADGWPQELQRRVRYRVNAMETALELCRRDLAATFVPEFVVALHNDSAAATAQLASRPLEPERHVDVHLAHRSDEGDLELVHSVVGAAARMIGCG